MPTKKIADLPKIKICRDPDHDPPGMAVFEPWIYEHKCPRCGKKIVFRVPERPTMHGFYHAKTIEQLAQEQGVKPFDPEEHEGFLEPEEVDALLAEIEEGRK